MVFDLGLVELQKCDELFSLCVCVSTFLVFLDSAVVSSRLEKLCTGMLGVRTYDFYGCGLKRIGFAQAMRLVAVLACLCSIFQWLKIKNTVIYK